MKLSGAAERRKPISPRLQPGEGADLRNLERRRARQKVTEATVPIAPPALRRGRAVRPTTEAVGYALTRLRRRICEPQRHYPRSYLFNGANEGGVFELGMNGQSFYER